METADNINPLFKPPTDPLNVQNVPIEPITTQQLKHFNLKKYIFVIFLLMLFGAFGLGTLTLMRYLKSQPGKVPTPEEPKQSTESTISGTVGVNSAITIKMEVDKLVITEEATGNVFVVNKLPTIPVEIFENESIKAAFEKTMATNKVWSKNKTKFAFLDTYEKGKQEVVVYDHEKRTVTVISDAQSLLKDQLVWSPEDNKIVYLDFASFGIGGGYYASINVYDFSTKETKNYGEYNAPLNLKWADNNNLSFEENNASGTFKKVISLDQSALKFLTIPIYPGSSFVKKEIVPPPCDEPTVGKCDYVSYQILTPASFDKVLAWYKTDVSASRWKVGLEAVVDGQTVATITKASEVNTIKLVSEGTSTKVTLLIQNYQKNLETAVRVKLKIVADAPVRTVDFDSNYAYGTAGSDNGTYWYGARTETSWATIVAGNDIPTCIEAKAFPLGIFGNKFDKCYEGSGLVDRNKPN